MRIVPPLLVPPLFAPVLLVPMLMAGCVAPPAPRPAPPIVRAPVRPAAPPAPASLPSDWRDWPLTPGDWRYEPIAGGSIATFGSGGTALAAARCVRSTRRVYLMRHASTAGSMTVRTSTLSRMLTFAADRDAPGGSVTTAIAANDPLLDAIAFSRGRWTIRQAGAAPLVLPAYAEVARVVEDCRG